MGHTQRSLVRAAAYGQGHRKEVPNEELAGGVCTTPGPDGFTSRFYRLCWSIIRGDIFELLMLSLTWIVVASII
jgi:hypothetical protein